MEIWHHPRCSKSRAALDLIQRAGIEPKIVLYLETPPSAERLEEVLGLLELEPREIMRSGETIYRELGLSNPALSRAELIQALVEHPILIERPIVIAGPRALIGRPPERVQELLEPRS